MGEKKSKKKSSSKSTQPQQIPEANGTQVNGRKQQQLLTPEPSVIEYEKTSEKQPNESLEKGKNVKAKKDKKATTKKKQPGFIRRLFTIQNIFICYIFYVVFACDGYLKNVKYNKKQPSLPFEQWVCSNGVSRYILEHNLFQRYVEPKITTLKKDYVEPSMTTFRDKYEAHGKPVVEPVLEKAYLQYETNAQPHVNTVKTYYFENVHTHVLVVWKQVKVLYNRHAKEHVDNIYVQSGKYYKEISVFVAPYLSEAQKQFDTAYIKTQRYYDREVLPHYRKHISPHLQKAWKAIVAFYFKRIEPTAQKTIVVLNDTYTQHIIPAYQVYLEPHVTTATEFILEQINPGVAERKAKAEAERKAKAEAARLAKEEAQRQAKLAAERKAKAEAENKAREEAKRKAERKAKEEAKLKAKLEAERKAKEEAERKAKEIERKAKEEAERKAKDKKAKEDAELAAKQAAELAAKQAATAALRKVVSDKFNKLEQQTTEHTEKFRIQINDSRIILGKVNSKADAIKISGSEHIHKLQKLIEQTKQDSSKTDKKEAVSSYAKQILRELKEQVNEAKKDAEETLASIKNQIETSANEFELIMTKHAKDAKKDFQEILAKHKKADNPGIDYYVRKLHDTVSDGFSIFKNLEADAIKEFSETVSSAILSIKKTAKSVAQEVYDAKTGVTEVFEQQHHESKVEIKSQKQPDNDEIKVLQKSADPVLDLLKKRRHQLQDTVLTRLKLGYQKYLAKQKSPENSSEESGDDDDYGEEMEECDVEGECG
ncbi:12464_t:CDS:2 [Ambispora gerdemannii]|uniref:12464_t:CDS:1 n=1 Tax=Ambispora gerdemannii TaxID=144530 RepID=A0A9N8VW45_9GLOM|nr:12464_t:CDS:2 [Ambispora gerdemannii]